MQFPAGDSNVTVVLPAPSGSVRLWWPAGAGAQPLYNLSATLRSSGSSVSSQRKVSRAENGTCPGTQLSVWLWRQVGFRHAVLVTGDDTDPAYVARAATEQGTELHGMFFRVNGAPIFARGANMIPMVSDAADRRPWSEMG